MINFFRRLGWNLEQIVRFPGFRTAHVCVGYCCSKPKDFICNFLSASQEGNLFFDDYLTLYIDPNYDIFLFVFRTIPVQCIIWIIYFHDSVFPFTKYHEKHTQKSLQMTDQHDRTTPRHLRFVIRIELHLLFEVVSKNIYKTTIVYTRLSPWATGCPNRAPGWERPDFLPCGHSYGN